MARKSMLAQLDALQGKRTAALDVFTRAAEDLEEVASDLHALAADAWDVAHTHEVTASQAKTLAHAAADKASAIRALLA